MYTLGVRTKIFLRRKSINFVFDLFDAGARRLVFIPLLAPLLVPVTLQLLEEQRLPTLSVHAVGHAHVREDVPLVEVLPVLEVAALAPVGELEQDLAVVRAAVDFVALEL